MCQPQAIVTSQAATPIIAMASGCQGACNEAQRAACPLASMMAQLAQAKENSSLRPAASPLMRPAASPHMRPAASPLMRPVAPPPLRSYRNPRPPQRLQFRRGSVVSIRASMRRYG